MLIAINPHIIDKSTTDVLKKENHSFENVDISIEQLGQHVNNGIAFCAQHRAKRRGINFIAAGFLAIDIDGGLTLEVAQANEFFQNYASLLYTTPSHTLEHHRFRIVFELEEPITDSENMRNALTGLIVRFGGDASCKDACRIFFGSSNSKPLLFGKRLPSSVVNELIIRGQETRVKSASKLTGSENSAVSSRVTLDRETVVTTGRGDHILLSEVDEKTEIFCPMHIDKKPSAFTLRSKHGNPGIYCSACNATFFLDDGRSTAKNQSFDFDYNWLKPTKISNEEYIDNMDDWCNVDLTELRGISKFTARYLPYDESLDYAKGKLTPSDSPSLEEFEFPSVTPEGLVTDYDLTLIKSPKGTGKTEWLTKLVKFLKLHNVSVLLIGHRRTLISATANRIGLTSYIRESDESSSSVSYNEPTPYYAICEDSLSNKIDPRSNKYDVILIDEVEQVFAHLLSSTMRNNRREVLHTLQYYLQNAKAIYALDADLNRVSVEILTEMLKDRARTCLARLNIWQPESGTIHLYQNKDHLIGELHASIQRGERCMVCSNSKKGIDGLHAAIKSRTSHEIRTISITSENAQKPEIQAFIKDIRNRALDYDVILASPAMGTGVDITFPNNEPLIDSVFGIFEARINTHFDIDQQLSRVRNPKRLNVWITQEEFNFETDIEAIKTELHALEGQHRAFLGIDSDGTKRYHEDPLYDIVFSHINAWQRASKNQPRKHFIDLRKNNGWTVEMLASDENLTELGKEIRKEGKLAERQASFEKMLQAEPITNADYIRYKQSEKAGKLEDDAPPKLRRYEIELFYRQDADMELLELDNDGEFRKAIRNYELLFCKTDEDLLSEAQYSESYYAADRLNLMQTKQLLSSLLTASGLLTNGKFNMDVQIEKSDLDSFADECLHKKTTIEQLLNMPVRNDVKHKPTQQLNAILKLLGVSTIRRETKQSGGKKRYIYQLDKNKIESIAHWSQRRIEVSSDTWKNLRYEEIERKLGGTRPYPKRSRERITVPDPLDVED